MLNLSNAVNELIPSNQLTFKDYYKLSLKINTLLETINQLTIEETDAFGTYLYETFFNTDEHDEHDEHDQHDEQYGFTKIDIKNMLVLIIQQCSELNDAEIIIDNLLDDLSYDEQSNEFENTLIEGVSRRMLPSHLNHKRRKFMKKSRAVLRREKTKRKRLNRLTRMKRKRYYKANKLKIKAYQKSRRSMIKRGRHIVKLRRRA